MTDGKREPTKEETEIATKEADEVVKLLQTG